MNSWEIAELRGKIAIEKVVRILKELKKEGKIRDFGETIPFSREDKRGIDIFIFPFNKKEIRLQIKAGDHLTLEEKEKYRKGKIFLIKNVLKKTDREIKNEILKILKS